MITKTQIIEALNQFPEVLELDALIERLIFIQKVEKGLADSAMGRTYSTLEAKQKLKKWQK